MFVRLIGRMDAEALTLPESLVVAAVATVLRQPRAASESSVSRWRSDRNAA